MENFSGCFNQELRPLVLKQLDFLNAWQGKKSYSPLVLNVPDRASVGALNRFFHKKLDNRVISALEQLGFRLIRKGNHIAMLRENPDGTRTPLTIFHIRYNEYKRIHLNFAFFIKKPYNQIY